MLLSEQLKEKLRNEFMPIKNLKIYSNAICIKSENILLKIALKGHTRHM
jgi:hypothetical protein